MGSNNFRCCCKRCSVILLLITLKNLLTISDPWTHIGVSNHTTFRPIWSGAMVPLNITPSVVVKYVWIFVSLIGQVGDLLFKIASILLKETVPRDFRLLFFSWISSPKPLSIPLGTFRIFSKIRRRYSPPVSLTPVANGKIFNQKNFNYFVWTPLGRRVNTYIYIYIFLPSSSL